VIYRRSWLNKRSKALAVKSLKGMQDQYRSDLLGQLGSNANSGIGADYVSRNLINQQQQYQQYYQNLGLSLPGGNLWSIRRRLRRPVSSVIITLVRL